jgi:hypothetical protein
MRYPSQFLPVSWYHPILLTSYDNDNGIFYYVAPQYLSLHISGISFSVAASQLISRSTANKCRPLLGALYHEWLRVCPLLLHNAPTIWVSQLVVISFSV